MAWFKEQNGEAIKAAAEIFDSFPKDGEVTLDTLEMNLRAKLIQKGFTPTQASNATRYIIYGF